MYESCLLAVITNYSHQQCIYRIYTYYSINSYWLYFITGTLCLLVWHPLPQPADSAISPKLTIKLLPHSTKNSLALNAVQLSCFSCLSQQVDHPSPEVAW